MKKGKSKRIVAHEARFVLCDDVRQEIGGKISLLGAYLNDQIKILGAIPKTELPSGMLALVEILSFVVSCHVDAGSHSATLKVFQPDGSLLGKLDLGNVDGGESGETIMIFRGRGFPIPAFGTYTAEVNVGEETYSHSFEVIDGRTPASD